MISLPPEPRPTADFAQSAGSDGAEQCSAKPRLRPEEGGDNGSRCSQPVGGASLGRPGEGAMSILQQLECLGVKPTRITADSRRVQPGDVFVAFPGAHADGRDFIAQAVARGAAAVLAEAGVPRTAKVMRSGIPGDGAGETAIVEVEGLAALSGEIAHLV